MDGILDRARTFLDTHLFNLGASTLTVGTVATAVGILLLSILISRGARKGIEAAFRRRGVSSPGTVAAVARLIHYTVIFAGLAVALQTAGVDLGTLFTAGAVFAVGLGFALQNIAQNFVSGIILLVERAIKPGDVLMIETRVVKVEELGIRATTVRSRDGEELIVPNTVLVQSTVINYTLRDSQMRTRVSVGVTYGSDMNRVRRVLEQVGSEVGAQWGSKRSAQVLMTGLGDSAVNWELAVWHREPWEEPNLQSQLYEAVWHALEEAAIVIAFPQLDVHFDPPVNAGLARLAPAASA